MLERILNTILSSRNHAFFSRKRSSSNSIRLYYERKPSMPLRHSGKLLYSSDDRRVFRSFSTLICAELAARR